MRLLSSFAVVLLISLLAEPGLERAHAVFEMKICEHCRRLWNDSPSRIRCMVDANGKQKSVHVCSPFCLASVLKAKAHYKPVSTQIVPWGEREALDAPMLSTASAKFLIDVSDKRDKSHDPDIAAFRSDKQLGESRDELGGEKITWEKVMERCRKLAAENVDEVESDYRPKRHRQY
jgi:hypothetical protein